MTVASPELQPTDLANIATEVARQLNEQAAGPEGLAGALDFSGGFTITVTYKGTPYAATLAVPTADFKAYLFKVTSGAPPNQLILIQVVVASASSWSVTAGLPEAIKIGTDFTLNFKASIQDGSPPTPA